MFSVLINEKKITVKGPQKPMAVLLPTPHRQKEHQEKSRKRRETKSGARAGRGGLPCAVRLVTDRKRLLFARKGVGSNVRRQRGQ